MIGTNLPPGTKIVCINDIQNMYHKPNVYYNGDLDGLTKGIIYTIKEYFEVPLGAHKGDICVVLNEITRISKYNKNNNPLYCHNEGFNRARFRRLHLPECLTELLNVKELEDQLQE